MRVYLPKRQGSPSHRAGVCGRSSVAPTPETVARPVAGQPARAKNAPHDARRLAAAPFVPPAGAARRWRGAAFAAAAALVKGPYVTGLSDTTVDVRFELDAPAAVTLEVVRERAPAPLRKVVDTPRRRCTSCTLTGLEPGKPYTYGVTLGPTQGPVVAEGRFRRRRRADGRRAGDALPRLRRRPQRPTAHAAVVRAHGRDPVGLPRQHGRHRRRRRRAAPTGSRSSTSRRRCCASARSSSASATTSSTTTRPARTSPGTSASPDAAGAPRPYGTGAGQRAHLLPQRDARLVRRARSATGSSASSREPTPSRARLAHRRRAPRPLVVRPARRRTASSRRRTCPTCSRPTRWTSSSRGTTTSTSAATRGRSSTSSPAAAARPSTASAPRPDGAQGGGRVPLRRGHHTPSDLRIVAHRVDGTVLDKCGFAKGAAGTATRRPRRRAAGGSRRRRA